METATIKLYNKIQYRLTALWAISESGLGGLMHALKIPFTGFFLAGFAIVIIVLIAHHAEKPIKAISNATLLVILIKATASPHSPPMAYLAVGFQGLCGMLCLCYIPWKRLGAILFGLIAMFESAVQKFLVTTIIFGKSIWEALDLFFLSIAKDLSLPDGFSFSLLLIGVYTAIYCLWGAILGWWAMSLTHTLNYKAKQFYEQFPADIFIAEHTKGKSRYSRKNKLVYLSFSFIFICSVFIFGGLSGKVLYVLIRTIAALLLLYFILIPLSKWALEKWIKRNRKKNESNIDELLQLIPEMKANTSISLQLAGQHHKGFYKYRAFVVNLIILSLYEPVKEVK